MLLNYQEASLCCNAYELFLKELSMYKYILLIIILSLPNNLFSMVARLSKSLRAFHITKTYKAPIVRLSRNIRIPKTQLNFVQESKKVNQQKEINTLLDQNIVTVFKSIYDLDKEKDDNQAMLKTCTHLPWLSCMIKLGTDRIRGAEKMRACIEKNNLKLIVLPVQWEYKIPEDVLKKELELLGPRKISRAFTNAYHQKICINNILLQDLPIPSKVCVAQRLECTGKKPLTLCQVQEMVVLIEELGWWDCGPKNYVHMDDKIGIIDTEERGLHKDCVDTGLEMLLKSPMDADARQYVEAKLNAFLTKKTAT